ncbi:MAG TPA: hypothetical protein VMX38_06245 [Verrucomicrobiae bacterium]|nr:hypothetical protein [Verrucomicrobiae bacterium]
MFKSPGLRSGVLNRAIVQSILNVTLVNSGFSLDSGIYDLETVRLYFDDGTVITRIQLWLY